MIEGGIEMGYILPVQQHTYKNYQYRMYKKDKTPHQIQGARKVKFIPIQPEIDFYKQEQQIQRKERIRNEQNKKKLKPKAVMTYKITERKKVDIDKKGQHINVKV